MRSFLVVSMSLGLGLMLGGCCKKDTPAPTTTTTTATATPTATLKRGDVAPGCTGMKTAAECQGCCSPQYTRATFRSGQCTCIVK
jgi:PBP1b-binding outer membrane lipoprotein LpoB